MDVQARTRFVAVGTRRIHVAEQGEGPPVLMLHGGGPGASGMSNYARNVEVLARRFRVIVPDMPGYGASSKGVSRSDPFGDLATGMLGLLDAMNIAKVHAVGNSLGGACALRMALDHPQRIDRLVLMGPGGINTTRGLPTEGLRKLLNYYKDGAPTLERMREFIGYLVFDPSSVPEALIKARFEASIDPEVVASPPLRRPKTLVLSRIDFTRDRRLSSLPHPVLVLWGREDRVNPASGGLSLVRRLPRGDLHLFSRTGHWVQWERPDEFNAITANFLQQSSLSAVAS